MEAVKNAAGCDAGMISRKFLVFMDVLIICALVFHFSTLFVTNVMVAKNTIASGQEITFVEANPIASATHDFVAPATQEAKERGISKLVGFMFEALTIGFILALYIFYRIQAKREVKKWHIFRYIMVVCMFFITASTNFIYDFGFFMGKVIFGWMLF